MPFHEGAACDSHPHDLCEWFKLAQELGPYATIFNNHPWPWDIIPQICCGSLHLSLQHVFPVFKPPLQLHLTVWVLEGIHMSRARVHTSCCPAGAPRACPLTASTTLRRVLLSHSVPGTSSDYSGWSRSRMKKLHEQGTTNA